MKPEIEKRIFGYVDPMLPIEGSWKAEVFKLIEQAEEMGDEDFLKECIDSFSAAVSRMRKSQEKFIVDLMSK